MNDQLEKIILQHAERYPQAQVKDYLKLLFQNEFGCGHLLNAPVQSLERLKKEYQEVPRGFVGPYLEDIGGGFARLHLSVLEQTSLSIETFHRIFELSAQKEFGSIFGFFGKIDALRHLCQEKRLPIQEDDLVESLELLSQKELRPFSHSADFHQNYRPAYRVIEKKYAEILDLLIAIDQKLAKNPPILLSIDGDCGSGKTTLAEMLCAIYGSSRISMDDFFLQKEQRTPERLAEIGGNIDYERFNEEVLLPLKAGKHFSYRPFNCQTFDFDELVFVYPNRLTIIEGSYSQHPLFRASYDLKVFLSVPSQIQEARILKRNGQTMLEKFRNIWIPMEKRFFEAFQVQEESDLGLQFLTDEEKASLAPEIYQL